MIRSWYYNYLFKSHGRYDANGNWIVEKPTGFVPLKQFPDDFHVFIVTNDQRAIFLERVKEANLHIHYQDLEPSFNSRYPNDPPKLWLFVLTVKPSTV